MRVFIVLVLIFIKAEAQSSALSVADSLSTYGKYNAAIKVLNNETNKSESLPRIAKYYAALGNVSNAIQHYESALKLDAENQIVRFQLAKLYLSTKNYETAKTQLLTLIDLDYKNPNYHYQLGLVYTALKDEFSAQSRFFTAYELDASNQKNIYQLAKYHFIKNNEKSFSKYLNKGLTNDPENKALLSLKGQHAYNNDNYKKALIQFKKLLELNENTQFVNEKLSWCYEKLYQDKEAIIHLKKALAFDKKNTSYFKRLAKLNLRLDEFAEAEAYYKMALLIEDVSLEREYMDLAMVLSRQEKYEEAIAAYKNALRFNPKSERARALIVIVKTTYYKDYDSKIEAIEAFKKRYPESVFNRMLDHRLSELKREKFHKGN